MVTGLVPLLQVFDVLESLRFYRDLLEFQVVASSPEVDTPEGRFSHWTLLRLGSAELMLNSAWDEGRRPPTRDAERTAAHGDIELYLACPDADAVHARLRERGMAVDPPTTSPYGTRQLRLRDPDGYELCFQSPAPGVRA